MKRRIIFRLFPFNRLTFPLLLNVWETHGLDRRFEIRLTGSDTRIGARTVPPLLGEIGSFRPGDVLLYSFMTPHLPQIAAEVDEIVRARSDAGVTFPLLAAGGPHVSADSDLPARLGFDVLFRGPGEDNFRRFGEDLLVSAPPFGAGRGPRVYEAVDCPSWTDYFPISRHSITFPPLEIMRGCHWRCSYCQTGGGRPQFRPQRSIERYLALMRRHGAERVNFISPSSLEYGAARGRQIDLLAVEGVLRAARSAGFRLVEYGIFPSEVRPDTLTDEAVGMLKQLVSNRRLTVGAQSGQADRLRQMRRGHGTADVESGIEAANRAGFRVNLDFILALPGEGEEETHANVTFIRGLCRRHRVNVHLHHFFPLAGSAYGDLWPAELNPRQRRWLLDLRRHGLGSDWWVEGRTRYRQFRRWLEKRFPDRAERYS
jgi:radical SAM superfamily enzyme YgiQ (UPF0313 family)